VNRITDLARTPGAAREAKAFDYYPCLGRVRDHVLEHLGEEITLAGAATIAGLEYHHFSRVFHERIGICFRDWLCAIRVARAMELLSQRDVAISRVGASVGFADRRSLQRAFQRWLGITPREYRALARTASRTAGDGTSHRRSGAVLGGDESSSRLYAPRQAPGSVG
jgi:AraC-like DNA-binding protein